MSGKLKHQEEETQAAYDDTSSLAIAAAAVVLVVVLMIIVIGSLKLEGSSGSLHYAARFQKSYGKCLTGTIYTDDGTFGGQFTSVKTVSKDLYTFTVYPTTGDGALLHFQYQLLKGHALFKAIKDANSYTVNFLAAHDCELEKTVPLQ